MGVFLIFCSLDKMAAMRSLVPANLSKFAGQACMHVFLNNFLILGDIETAKTMLNHCLEKHDRFSEGHLLMAQVLLYCSMFFAYFSPRKMHLFPVGKNSQNVKYFFSDSFKRR